MPKPRIECRWTADGDGVWETGCGHAFEFNAGGPSHNEMRFCGYCGLPLIEVEYQPEPLEEDVTDA